MDLQAVIRESGFSKLTPIQEQAIPLLAEGRDLIGQSKTGSGKTAAFAIPLVAAVDVERREPQALVMCPTRELCEQVAREIRKLGRQLPGFQVLILCGGQPGRPQRDQLERGVHIIVGTPGRILDHLDRGNLQLHSLRTLVLDEADRMLDMGFEDEMTAILNEAPSDRQTVFFSATFPPSIGEMSRRYQRNPATITVADTPEDAPSIEQIVYDASAEQKPGALLRVLHDRQPIAAIVFCNLKSTVAELAELLTCQGVAAAALHGDLEQEDRNKVMAMFRNESARVLVATDVAARGLDVDTVDLVVNYDLPLHEEDYVHRIGRTGRAGRSGRAVSLATSQERTRLASFARANGAAGAGGTAGVRGTGEPAGSAAGAGAGGTAGVRGGSAVRLEPLPKAFGEQGLPFVSLEARMSTVYISGGRKDKVRPGDILGALTGETGDLKASDIGKIEIFDRFAYVGIARGPAAAVVQRLKSGRIKGKTFIIRLVVK